MLELLTKYLCIIVSLLLLVSCGLITDSKNSTIIKGSRIELPIPPKPLGIQGLQDVSNSTHTLVDPPLVAEPFQYWRAYKDGAIIWKPKDWRIIDEHIKTSQNWISTANEQVKTHNKIFDVDESKHQEIKNKPWYQIW